MSMTEILTMALELPDAERAALARQLLLSLEPPGPVDSDEEAWQEAWMEEIRRRMDRLDRGETKTSDAYEALEDIRNRLRGAAHHAPTNPAGS